MPTRVLGSRLGALRELDSPDTIEDPTSDPAIDDSFSIPQDYIDTLASKRNTLVDLRNKYDTRDWWPEYSSKVSTMLSKIKSAISEALETGTKTRPGLPTRAQSLIDGIKSTATQAQDSGGTNGGGSNGGGSDGGGSNGGGSGGGDTSDDRFSVPTGDGSSSDRGGGENLTVTKDSPEQTIAGFPVSQVKMVLTGGMLLGGAYFFLSEQ